MNRPGIPLALTLWAICLLAAPGPTVPADSSAGPRTVYAQAKQNNGAIATHIGVYTNLTLTSLDLTDPQTVNQIVALQQQGQLGGKLQTSGGVATGGDVILQPANLAATISAENIPANVTVTMQGFQPGNPINISLTSGSTTKHVLIGGSEEFVPTNSGGVISISSTEAGPVLAVSNSGVLRSDGSLTIASPSISNAGTIRSGGDLDFAAGGDFRLDNTGGVVQAECAINVRDPAFEAKADAVAIGGDWLSPALNFYSGKGTVNVDVGQVTGVVNMQACDAHVMAASETLRLGRMDLAGEPTFFNRLGDDVIMGGLIYAGEALAIVASGNITTTSGAGAIDTSSSSGNGGSITIVAGVSFASSDGDSGSNDHTSTLLITGASATGGKIDLTVTAPITSLNSSSSSSGSNGGDVTLVAYPGSNPGSGTISLPSNVTIQTGGGGTGASGNVNIIAGAPSGTSITTGSINTTGGSGVGGDVTLFSATPMIVGGQVVIQNGQILQGRFNAGTIQAGSISPGSVNAKGSVTLNAGGAINLPSAGLSANGGDFTLGAPSIVFASGTAVSAGSSFGVNLNSAGLASGLTITSPQSSSASVSTSGGAINITPTSGQSLTFQSSGSGATILNLNGGPVTTTTTSASTTVGSNVTLSSNNSITMNVNNSTLTNNGTITSSASAGSIVIQSTGALTLAGTGMISVTGGGAASISVSASGANALTFNGSQTFNAGALGSVSINSQATGGSISLGGNWTVLNGASFTISTPSVSFAGSSSIAAPGASTININSGGGSNPLTITAPSGGSATISTLGGAINIGPTTGQNLIFKKSAAGVATLNLNGLPVNMGTSASITVDSGVTLSSYVDLYISTPSLSNAGTIQSGGMLPLGNSSGLTVTGGGTLSASTGIRLTSSAGAVSVTQGSIVGTVLGGAAQSFSLSTNSGGLTVGSIGTSNGSISLVAGSGPLQVFDYRGPIPCTRPDVYCNATISATNGDLILQNQDTSSGSIFIGQKATLSASSSSSTAGGRVILTIGPVPSPPVVGSAPTNFSPVISNGGNIFYGGNSIAANTPTNTATVNGGVLIFNTGARPASAITLNGSDTINVTGQAPMLTSLDLTDPAVTSSIVTLQQQGRLLGNLQTSGGVATGGNVILQPVNLAPTITAENIPANVTVTMQGFQSGNPLNVSLTASSTTTQAIVGGTLQFVTPSLTSGSAVGFSISSTQAGPVLVIGSTGQLTSDGSLSVTANGTISGSGIISAQRGILGLSSTGGNIQLSSISLRTNSLNINLEAHAGNGNAGTISIGNTDVSGLGGIGDGGAGGTAGNITITADGSISTGYLRAYGGGGGGSYWAGGTGNGGAGGSGGTIHLSSSAGGISISGDINTSGGGGGGGYYLGGAGGNAGSVTITSPGTVTISGPVLAAGGGGGGSCSSGSCASGGGGGGSFGGGGGGSAYGGGGGGFSGGGGGGSSTWGYGGGFSGGGTGGAAGGLNGGNGFGGGGSFGSGGIFGVGGGAGGSGATSGFSVGSAGAASSGDVSVAGSSVQVNGTVNSFFGSLGNPFSSSPYASYSGNGRGLTLATTGAGNSITICDGCRLTANNGNLTLQNNDTSAGSISIGVNAMLTASSFSTAFGNVYIVIGPIPSSPVAGSAPANFTSNLTNGGQIFFGANGITANPPSNMANVNGGRVVFNTGSRPPSAITLNGGVTINSTFIVCPQISISPLVLQNGTVGVAYNQTLSPLGGAGPYTSAVTGGSLPPNISLNSSTNALSGTPSTAGSFNFTITATDANSCKGSQNYTITIVPNNLSLPSTGSFFNGANPPTGYVGTYTINATLTNNGPTLSAPIYFQITQLAKVPPDQDPAHPNRLLSADNGAGVVGDKQTLPITMLATSASTPVKFVIGLGSRQRFTFFVDLYAGSVGPIADGDIASSATAAQLVGHFEYTLDPTATSPLLQFSSANYTVNEGAGSMTITVTRTVDVSSISSVDFATGNNDYAPCSQMLADHLARQNCKFTRNTGTLTFNAGDSSQSFTILINDEAYVEGDTTFPVTLSNAAGGTLGAIGTATVTINDNDTAQTILPAQFRFGAALNGAQETPPNNSQGKGGGVVLLSQNQTSEQAGLLWSNLTSSQTAQHIHGPGAPGTAAPIIFTLNNGTPVINQVFNPSAQQVSDLKAGLHYMNVHTTNFPGGEIRGQLLWNPTLEENFFVNQHYYDFLQRIPDASGFAYWTGQISQCIADVQCFHDRTIGVSNAFFFELEYQQTGAYVYRLFRAAYGNTQPSPNPDTSNTTEANKIPSYDAYATLRARVVGGSDLATGQQNAANTLVNRPEFIAKYSASPTLSQFVDAVLGTIQAADGVDLSSQKAALVALGSRAAVMYRLANDDLAGGNGGINNRAFIDAEYNRAFVITQYFGYLRRDGDIGGILFWLGQVNSAPLRDTMKQNAMVCSFITSIEYQARFGPNIPRTNAECPQ